MIRILSIDSPKMDGVSWWRNIRPLTELQRKWPDIQVSFASESATLQQIMAADVVIMYRPVTSESLQFIKNCKTLGKVVILDIDDNLWRLPPGHPSEAQYITAAPHIRQIYALADGIWCSTEPLMYFTDAMDGRGRVIPNAVLESDLPDKPAAYNGVVCWRGSAANMMDVVNDGAVSVFNENKDRFKHWFFWGYHPAEMRAANTKMLPYVDVVKYIFGLRDNGINIMWKPLQENEFNDAKSNIAWIEATMAGGICVTNYATKPGWEMAIDHFTDNPDFIASQWAASRKWIIEHYNLDKVNAIRYHHILQLLGIEGQSIKA